MCHIKNNLEVSDSESHYLPSYNELFKAFHEMYDGALNSFKKIASQKKNILKFEEKIFRFKSALESLKEEHASLVSDQLHISNTLK